MTVAIIPARGGSKGLPGKNIKDLMGKPLIAWSIESALNSKLVDEVYVSTEDKHIKECALSYGANVDIRPIKLASDNATTISVIQDFILRYPKFDTIVILQPTSPIRNTSLIDDCLKKFNSQKFSNLATGYYCKMKEFGTHKNTRRQDYKGFFYDDGNVYVLSSKLAKDKIWCGERPFKYEIDRYMNYEIDDEIDFTIVETLLKKYKHEL